LTDAAISIYNLEARFCPDHRVGTALTPPTPNTGTPMSSDPPSASSGSRELVRIGKYEVLDHVATGGMGAVYKARDTETNREVALKVLNADAASKPALVERFKREARNAGKLQHENIVAVYDFDEEKGTWYLAMEFVEGVDLHEYIERKGVLDPEESRQIMIQACRALAHAYRHGIVHRDIKPSNFLLARKKEKLLVKLADMGLSREVSNEEFRVTRAGTTVGTVDYMAPEQARDSGSADIRSDLYALGCTWFHMLTGQAPFPKGGLAERLIMHMEDDPPDVRKLNPRVSKAATEVLYRLMEKDPDDRYQTPTDLLDDLLSLNPAARRPPSRETLSGEAPITPSKALPAARRPSSNRRAARRTDASTEAAPPPPRRSNRVLWVFVTLGVASAVVLGVFAALGPNERKRNPVVPINPNPPRTDDSIAKRDPAPDKDLKPEKDRDKKDGETVKIADPPKSPWKPLYEPAGFTPESLRGLRAEVEKPWANQDGLTTDARVLHVRRLPDGQSDWFASLTDALAAKGTDKVRIIELHDNGPLYETPAPFADRRVFIRAAKGYRPLIVWDVPRVLDERKSKPSKSDDERPLTFLEAQRGGLTLEGVELAIRLPESVLAPATVLQATDAELTAHDCVFSIAGGKRSRVTLARLGGAAEGLRCRLTRCYARGPSLTPFIFEAPAAEALLDGTLIAVGEQTLFQVRAPGDKPVHLSIVRSTLIGGKNLLELSGAQRPALKALVWDSLVARSNEQAGGALLELAAGASADAVSWRAVNSLYTGWSNLLGGAAPIGVDFHKEWLKLWKLTGGDVARRGPWPVQPTSELEERPARTFQAAEPVAFAASVAPEQPLGVDLAALPPAREGWQALAFERTPMRLPDPPSDARPDIPVDASELYRGEALDLNKIKDLGAYLATKRLGKSVVLHLSGTGEKTTSPIRLKDVDLTLYFELPKEEKDKPTPPPLSITHPDMTGEAMIEVEKGSLEVINGEFRFYDSSRAKTPAWLFKVSGGDLRLSRCRLYGPQQTIPDGYEGLIRWQGSDVSGEDKVLNLAVSDSILLSRQTVLRVEGIGARVLLRQSILAGTDLLNLELGPNYKGRAEWQGLCDHCTLAARRSVLRLGPTSCEEAPEDPGLLQTRDCVFANPFREKDARGRAVHPGLLTADATALGRGVLMWQSDGDAYDTRLYFRAAAAPPEQPQSAAVWLRLLGSPNLRRVLTLDAPRTMLFDDDRWYQHLERLALPPQWGAGDKRPGADVKKMTKKGN
jgi:serine/threonine-protein kinase